MIEIKPRYRVRLENALIECGACAIETEIAASSATELQDNVIAFMDSIGVRSNNFEIFRLDRDPISGLFVGAPYVVGIIWRTEEITRVENHHHDR